MKKTSNMADTKNSIRVAGAPLPVRSTENVCAKKSTTLFFSKRDISAPLAPACRAHPIKP